MGEPDITISEASPLDIAELHNRLDEHWVVPGKMPFLENYLAGKMQHLLLVRENGVITAGMWLDYLRFGNDAWINYFIVPGRNIFRYFRIAKFFIKFYFDEYRLKSLRGRILTDNKASLVIAKRLGFKIIDTSQFVTVELTNGFFIQDRKTTDSTIA